MRFGWGVLLFLPCLSLAATALSETSSTTRPRAPMARSEQAPRVPASDDEFEWSEFPSPDSATKDTNKNASSDTSSTLNEPFVKPKGPPQGGTVRAIHPDAGKGLLRINKDGSYQYKTKLRPKSQAMSVGVLVMAPPTIQGPNGATFKSIYGSGNVYQLAVNYEWDPIKSFGALGLQLGTGLATAHGNGVLSEYQQPSQETYNLFIVPFTANIIYRFEYVRRQWIVPFVNGGITYYGMAEKRDDNKPVKFAGAPAVGGGGGVHLSISRLDQAKAFTLDREYGIADMWLTLEARAVKGLYTETDFSSEMVSVGITVDY